MDLSSRLVWTSNGFPKERFLSMAFTRIFEEEQTSENSSTDWLLEASSKESNNSFFNNSTDI